MKKVAFLGYDFFYSCFEMILNDGNQILWLFTVEQDNVYNFNQKVIHKAQEIGAKIYFTRISEENIRLIKDEGCDLIVSAAYPYKIPLIDNSPFIVNIHPALLPIGRGSWPLPITILKELSMSGVTIHKVSKDFDAGDILIQESFPVQKRENLETLSCKVQILAKKLLLLLLKDFDSLWENATPQGEGEYWPMPSLEDRTLNWNLSILEIDKRARAFGKFDSCAIFEGKEWIVQDLNVWQIEHNDNPGSVVHKTNKEIVIAASDGYVCIRFYEIDPDFEA